MNNPESISINVQPGATTTALVYPAEADPSGATLILGHGAGADQRSTWMATFARSLAQRGLDVVTFNFLYTERRRGAPDRRPMLDACYREVVHAVRRRVPDKSALFIGGKSMGGRIATHIAADGPDLPVQGIVLLGYPLHPPGRPEQARDAHLPAVRRPMLFVQGSRDTFGTPAELQPILERLEPRPTLYVVEGGDHSFKATKNAARQAAVIEAVQQTVVDWIQRVSGARRL